MACPMRLGSIWLLAYGKGKLYHGGCTISANNSRRHAIKAISGPKHLLAMRQAAGAYEVYDLERWILRKEAGFAELSLRKWDGGEVGW